VVSGEGETGVDAAGKAEYGRPLAFAASLPDDVAVEEGGGFFGGDVVVEVEVAGVVGLVGFAEVDVAGGWSPFGGEE
jgi:hypothetical protein